MNADRFAMVSCAVCVVMAVGVLAAQGQSEARLDPSIRTPPARELSVDPRRSRLAESVLTAGPQGVILSARSVNRVRDTVPHPDASLGRLTSW